MPPSEPQPVILLVDDDPQVTRSLGQWLELSDVAVHVASSVDRAEAVIEAGTPVDAVLSDVRMPGRDGLNLLRALRQRDPDLPVVLLSGHADVPMAVEALKAGAFDFLTKPADPERVVAVLRNAAAQNRLRRKVAALEARLSEADAVENRLIGHSAGMAALRREIAALAGLPIDVILVGETGTGKEVVAEALHAASGRSGRFVAVNCAAIPADIFESELFGHESGAFTGAREKRVGKLEYASGGTLLLDEIESMPLAAQGKILRVMQERTIERLGSNRAIPVDLRVIAATKIDLRTAAAANQFRLDLYYRLAGVELHLPPLRERREDIPVLFSVFASRMAERAGRKAPEAKEDLLVILRRYDWPGNVRELRRAAERFALGLDPGVVPREAATAPSPDREGDLADRVARFEAEVIREALQKAGGSIAAVVEALGIPRRTLNEKMQRHGIRREDSAGD
ncbi:MAG TPA: sigma-54 dependent transcriptional regulator [Rhabdaerophilum sp.]|nr:sigma-54 dependent transcriptional regulator [Rhabdaerophilum sp.]